MKWPPTDLEILEEIYRRHYDDYVSFNANSSVRSAKVYVPIDIKSIADHFGTDVDIVFGRLYYHLNPRFGFKNADGSSVHFFTLKAGTDTNVVQFPLLASVLAQLRSERQKHLIATWLSVLAVLISLLALGVSLADLL